MTRLPRQSSATPWHAVVVLAAGVVVVTCGGATIHQPHRPQEPRATASPAVSARGPAAPVESAAEVPAPPGPRVRSKLRLDNFFADLRSLPSSARHVRILWYGDSHSAADFWPDAVRKPLQERFGNGGPGFVHVGLKRYRHAGIRSSIEGTWSSQPKAPSYVRRQLDGAFGLGGIRTVVSGSDAVATLKLASAAAPGGSVWRLYYRLPSEASGFTFKLGNSERETVNAKTRKPASPDEVLELRRETTGDTQMVLGAQSGSVELLGAIIEAKRPGVVLDTLGINGARIGTPLSWEETHWQSLAKARNPALAVLAYGTNEVGENIPPEKYGPQFEQMVARLRMANPRISCLLIGPTDRADREWRTKPRVVEIDRVQRSTAEKLGCGYFSAFDAMGGKGGIKRWADEQPPHAARDRVHLLPRGYARLGKAIADAILADFEAVQASVP